MYDIRSGKSSRRLLKLEETLLRWLLAMQRIDLLFRYASAYCNFLFDCEILERLRGKCELAEDLLTYRTRCRSEREQPIDARFTPGQAGEVELWDEPHSRSTSYIL